MAHVKIGEEALIYVGINSPIRMFEKAFEAAVMKAQFRFGMDEDGHAEVEGWERSRCSLQVEFQSVRVSCGMSGWSYSFKFKAWCEKYEEDDA